MTSRSKTQIESRDGGYTQFAQRYTGGWGEKSKEAKLKVRRVTPTEANGNRNETQIEISIDRIVEKKTVRVYTELFSLILTPEDAKALAAAISPESSEETKL